jgi:hypothetical protein
MAAPKAGPLEAHGGRAGIDSEETPDVATEAGSEAACEDATEETIVDATEDAASWPSCQ